MSDTKNQQEWLDGQSPPDTRDRFATTGAWVPEGKQSVMDDMQPGQPSQRCLPLRGFGPFPNLSRFTSPVILILVKLIVEFGPLYKSSSNRVILFRLLKSPVTPSLFQLSSFIRALILSPDLRMMIVWIAEP